MEISSNNAFQVIFPKYVDLLSETSLNPDQSLEAFLRDQLPQKIQLVRNIEQTFLAFQTQFTNLILKRPRQSSLIQSLLVKAAQKIDKYFYGVQLKCDKVSKNSLNGDLSFLNLQEIRTNFRQKLKDLEGLIKQKYIQNYGVDKQIQEQIAKRLYILLEVYHFTKNDLTSVATKYKLKESEVLNSINSNKEADHSGIGIQNLLYLDDGLIHNVHDLVSKRCRPFLGKKDFFFNKIKTILNQSESKVPMNISLLLSSIVSKQKYRVTKDLTACLNKQLKTIQHVEQQSQKQAKQIMTQVQQLKRQFSHLKNNVYYLDIIRGSFADKYKMELNKLENIYYLNNIEKYLQDVQTFMERLLRVQQKVIDNRKNFMRTLGKEIQEKIVGVTMDYEMKNGAALNLQQTIDVEFQALQNSLYGSITQTQTKKQTVNEQAKRRRVQQGQDKRRRLQQEKQQKQILRRRQMEDKAQQDKQKRQQDKQKLQQKRKIEEERLKKMKQQREQKQRIKKEQNDRLQQKRKLQMQKKIQQKRNKQDSDKQKMREQIKKREQQKNQRQEMDKKRRQNQKKERQQTQLKKKQQLQTKKQQQQRKKQEQKQRKLQQQKQREKQAKLLQEKKKLQQQTEQKRKQQQKKQKQLQKEKEKQKEKQRERLKKIQDQQLQKRKKEQQDRQAKEAQKRQKQQRQLRQRQKLQKQRKQKLERDENERNEKMRALQSQKQEKERLKKQKQEKQKKDLQKKQQQKRQLQRKEQEKKQQQKRDKQLKEQKQRQRQQQLKKQKLQKEQKQKQQKQQKQRQKKQQERIQKENQQKAKKQQKQRQKKQQERIQKENQQKAKKQKLQAQQRERQLLKKKAEQQLKIQQQKQKQKQKQRQRQRIKQAQRIQKEKAKNAAISKPVVNKGKKGGSGINYDEFDDIIDDDLQQMQNASKVQDQASKITPSNEYDDYEDDFESPQKQGQAQGQQQPEGEITQPQTIQLITHQSIKCLNDYMKGTSYARKNKVNLEPYNNSEQYQYLFEEMYQDRKLFIFHCSFSQALINLGLQLMQDDIAQDQLRISVEDLRDEIMQQYQKKLGSQIHPDTQLIFPFTFKNDLNIISIQVVISRAYFRIITGKQLTEQDQENRAKLQAVIEGLLHIFAIQPQPDIEDYVVSQDSKAVLDTFDKQLPCLLTLFAVYYEMNFVQKIQINQYTVERFFYALNILKPLYQAIENQEQKMTEFYAKLDEKYGQENKIMIYPIQIQSSTQNYEQEISQSAVGVKAHFLQNNKNQIILVMYQMLMESEEEEVVEKITLYSSIQRVKGKQKPEINYFAIVRDQEEKQNVLALRDMVSQGDQHFEVNLYSDFSRHNGLTSYSDWVLPLWARSIQKRKLNPTQAFRAITFAMTPFYVAYKQMD